MISPPLKKVVVTGGSGFIGQALIRYLVKTGCETTAVVHRSEASLGGSSSCRSTRLDLREKGALDKWLDSETTVFHLAALADVGASVRDPRADFETTLCGFFEVLESARRHRCQVIFPSTGSIFDPGNEQPVGEKSYACPSSPYGAAKLAGEAYCRAYHRSYGLDTRIARLFSVYGLGMKRFAIHDLVRKIQKDRHQLTLLGDGRQVRDYLSVEDVVEGLVLIATRGEPGEDYNLASGVPTRISDLASQIAKIMGCSDIQIRTTGEISPGEVPVWYANIDKIRSLGFSPQVSLEEGLERTVKSLCDDKVSADATER